MKFPFDNEGFESLPSVPEYRVSAARGRVAQVLNRKVPVSTFRRWRKVLGFNDRYLSGDEVFCLAVFGRYALIAQTLDIARDRTIKFIEKMERECERSA